MLTLYYLANDTLQQLKINKIFCRSYAALPGEAVLVNIIGLIFVIFGGLTVYIVSQERYRRLPRPEDDILLTGRNE